MWCFALVTGPHWLPWSLSLSKQPCVHAHWLQSCLTLCDPMGYNPPDSSVHGILEARILEWVASPSSKRSSQPQDWTYLSCITGKFFTYWATWEAPKQPCAHLNGKSRKSYWRPSHSLCHCLQYSFLLLGQTLQRHFFLQKVHRSWKTKRKEFFTLWVLRDIWVPPYYPQFGTNFYLYSALGLRKDAIILTPNSQNIIKYRINNQ